ncbi:MAG: hypothetical protein EBZ49_01425 [Proteobacteria bacterium]|nr:hypothetical protein [Pseudomonadota bacterium]
MKTCQKHLIQCHCILPQFRKLPQPVFHKFMVFSIIENDTVVPKYVQCNNCSAVHRVFDICKSEMPPGRDELRSVTTIDEIKIFIPSDLRSLLETYKCELPIWEHIKFCLDESRWGDKVILTRETIENEITGKILTIVSRDKFTLESYLSREEIE